MLFKSYQEFAENIFRIDENVQQAKIYLRKRALAAKKASPKVPKGMDLDKITLSSDEAMRAERNPDFIKIKDMLRDNAGYVLPFVKFFFEEEVPLEELQSMYDKIKEYRSVLSGLPMTVDKYADIVPDKSDERKGFERLGDDMEKIRRSRIVKKWVDRLYGSLRSEYTSSIPAVKEKVAEIAMAFDEFGKESDGTKDEKKNKELQNLFLDKIRRYPNLNETIQAALGYIKAAGNSNISKFFQNIQKVNDKYGEMNGAEIVYNEGNVLILEIKSYHANKELNANTSHCIATSSHQWDNYVGSDNNFTKQYYIYNFNLSPSDDHSVIGITIAPRSEIKACHTKSDRGFSSSIKSWMRDLKIPFTILSPMSDDDINQKKRRIIANKEIIKENLPLEKIKQYYEEGGDPNASIGKPLTNAVKENDTKKAEYLLSVGAQPNIGTAIKGASNIEMILLLVRHGATLTPEVFTNSCNDYDAVKYLIEAKMDVNFDAGFPIRTAVKSDRLDVVKLLVENGAELTTRRFMVIKWATEWGRVEILKWLLEQIEERELKVEQKSLTDWLHWAKTSDKIESDAVRKEIQEVLEPVVTRLKKELK